MSNQISLTQHNNLETKLGNETFIIVEIGSTHCASLDIAKSLIDVVKLSKANCVKLQKRNTNALLTKAGQNKPYNTPHSMASTYGEHRNIMEFSEEQFIELQNYAMDRGLFFTASGWDIPSIDFLEKINVPFFKIASADLTNIPLLEHIVSKRRPVVLSTGMGTMDMVRNAYHLFISNNIPLIILQCTSSYPTPVNDINLNTISTYQREFPKAIIGFSGHEKGIHITLASVALGAKVIEKHLTLNKKAKGTDHSAALEPNELIDMVQSIRDIEKAMGSFDKSIQTSEIECIPKLTKSITSKQEIVKDTIITMDMLTTKSPGGGISPLYMKDICGKITKETIPDDSTIYENMLK